MDTPQIALLISFWLHMLATVAWLGSLALFTFWALPTMKSTLSQKDFSTWMVKSSPKLDSIAWLSASLLIVSGLIQMAANPNYSGFLMVTNTWASALLIKHLVFFGMIAISAYITWGLHPALRRESLKMSQGATSEIESRLQDRMKKLMLANLVLGAIVLAFTALARIS